MAEQKKAVVKTQDPETKIEDGLAPPAPGETSPTADQSNRDAEIAARMAVVPVRTLGQQKAEQAKAKKEAELVNKDGETEFVDPDDLEEQVINEQFPKDVCMNCRNHGRGEVKLDNRGFCKKCGFKLNRVFNMALEPTRKPVQ
jgi:hypothetical protein